MQWGKASVQKHKLLLSRGSEWIEDTLLYEAKKKLHHSSNQGGEQSMPGIGEVVLMSECVKFTQHMVHNFLTWTDTRTSYHKANLPIRDSSSVFCCNRSVEPLQLWTIRVINSSLSWGTLMGMLAV